MYKVMNTKFAIGVTSLLVLGLFHSAFAQPSDEQVLKDMTNPGIIEVKLTPSNGQKQWNADYGIWEYVRGVNAIREYKEKEGVTIKIVGDAVYQMYGATDYKYWKFRVISNEYLGMGAPSSEELMEIVQGDFPKFLSSYWYNRIVGEVKALYIADDPNFYWHTPNSLSFNVVAEYTAKVSNIHLEDIVQTFEVRLYRDGEDKPWKNFISSARDRVNENRRELPREEMDNLKSLAIIDGERKAEAALAGAPKVSFSDPKEFAFALNRELRNGTPESVEAFLIQSLAPMHFASGSTILLSARGAQLVNQTVDAAFKGRLPYAKQFCNQPGIDERRSSASRIYLIGIGGRATAQVAFMQTPGGYVNGVQQPGELKITTLNLYLKQSNDDVAFFNSFTDPASACPED
jgi:hypothetical protein